jgi:hydrogenase expression/formation protein HypD
MVYAIDDALHLARAQPGRPVVFFAIGFETTAPSTAVALLRARREGLSNFSIYCNHVLTPPALRALLAGADDQAARIDGFIGPAHVSTIIGSQPYAFVATEYRRPLVIAGFEPLDVLQAILMLLRQCNAGAARVENEYSRVVNPLGNRKAQALLAEVFGTRAHFAWRGLGELPESALAIRAGSPPGMPKAALT